MQTMNFSQAQVGELMMKLVNSNVGRPAIIVGSSIVEEGMNITLEELYDETLIVVNPGEIDAVTPSDDEDVKEFQSTSFRTITVAKVTKNALTGEPVKVGKKVFTIFDKTHSEEWDVILEAEKNGIDKDIPLEGCKIIKVRYPQNYVIRDENGKPTVRNGRTIGANHDTVFVGSGEDYQTVIRRKVRQRAKDFPTSDGKRKETE